ncbi:MAG: glycosyltransferase family 2 protein [Candidatus Omnitrophota bacterium]
MIQIPCLNEEASLPVTLADLPKEIDGISKIERLVIDDGSSDRTHEVARELGVEHFVRFSKQRGLARAFEAGIEKALHMGADIVVNTDADNQYRGEDIARLVKPIVDGKADVVIGCRDIDTMEHFSFLKKRLQRAGSWVVRQVSGTDVPDVTTGFRAYNRKAMLDINVVSKFSYTLETIIAAGKKDLAIASVAIRTNKPLRKSRLFKSISQYVIKSGGTILRIYTMYEALRVFMIIGWTFLSTGFLFFLRYLYFHVTNQNPAGHIQSLILGAVLAIAGFQVMVFSLLADLISSNRKLIEDSLGKIKRMEIETTDRAASR